MSYSVVNVEEQIGKIVGRRVARDPRKSGMQLQKTVNQLRKSFGYGGICPRGVYRFDSHEEADTWMMRMLVARAIRPRN